MTTKPAFYHGFVAASLLAVIGAIGTVAVRAQTAAMPAGPIAVGPPPSVPTDPQQAIVERKAAMKIDGKIFKAMKAALAAGQDLRPYASDIRWLVDWGQEMPRMFPPGSEKGHDTKAKPDIWTNKAGFDQYAHQMVAAAGQLLQAVGTGKGTEYGGDFQALGHSCGGCHKHYAYPLH